MTSRPLLRFEDKIRGEERYLARLASPQHARFARNALAAALVVHAALLLLPAAKLRSPRLDPPSPRPAPVAGIWRSMPGIPSAPAVAAARPQVPGPLRTAAREPAATASPGGSISLRMTFEGSVGFALLPPPRDPVPEPPPRVDPALLAAEPDLLLGSPEPPPSDGAGAAPDAAPETPATLVAESRVVPDFPDRARAVRLGAVVVLSVEVGEDGVPVDVRVLRCSRPNLGFERAAIRAVEQWRWTPATAAGRPVRSRIELPLEFKP